jgi:hypothetical protein
MALIIKMCCGERCFCRSTPRPCGRMLSTLLAAIAEFERELIKERTGDGRKRAQAAGVKFGRKPKLTNGPTPWPSQRHRHPSRQIELPTPRCQTCRPFEARVGIPCGPTFCISPSCLSVSPLPSKDGKPAEPKVLQQNTTIQLNIDGRALGEVVASKLVDLMKFDTSSPAFNGTSLLGPSGI